MAIFLRNTSRNRLALLELKEDHPMKEVYASAVEVCIESAAAQAADACAEKQNALFCFLPLF